MFKIFFNALSENTHLTKMLLENALFRNPLLENVNF